jgi:26S proteasome regulatory subunit N9
LIRGSLDQVSSTADITWVQPRVLEDNQLDVLSIQFDSWRDGVGRTELEVENQRVTAREVVSAA